MAAGSSGRTSGNDRAITARSVTRLLVRGSVLALVTALAAGFAGYFVSSSQSPTYSAEVGVIASQPGSQYSDLNIITPPTVDPGVYQSAILDGDVVVEALTRLNGEAPSQQRLERFLESVRVRVEDAQRSSTIWVEVRDGSPEYAANAVNLIAEELIVWDRERARQSLDRSIAAIERSIAELEAEIRRAVEAGDEERAVSLRSIRDQRSQELATALQTSSSALVVGLLEPLRWEVPPETPVGPRVLFTTVIATLLGLVLGYGLQALRWTLDTRVGGRDDVMEATGLPVLAEFPAQRRGAVRASPEASGFFHTNVVLSTRGASPRLVVVTSPTKPFERAGAAMSLAENFARSGQRTLLVDADLRHPGLTDQLDLVRSSAVSLDAYLGNPEQPFLPVSVAIGGKQSFDFVPSFTSERFPVDLLNEGFEGRLEAWKQEYDAIVFDSAPVVPFADTLAIAPFCSGVVLCVSATRTTREQLDDALDVLAGPQVPVLGIAVTDVRDGVRRSRSREGASSGGSGGAERLKTRVPTGRRSNGSSSRRA